MIVVYIFHLCALGWRQKPSCKWETNKWCWKHNLNELWVQSSVSWFTWNALKEQLLRGFFRGATRRASISQSVRTPSHFLILYEALSLTYLGSCRMHMLHAGLFLMITTPVAPLSLSHPAARSLRRFYSPPQHVGAPCRLCALAFSKHAACTIWFFGTAAVNGAVASTFQTVQTGREFLVNQAHDHSQGGSALSSVLFFYLHIRRYKFWNPRQIASVAIPVVLYKSAWLLEITHCI